MLTHLVSTTEFVQLFKNETPEIEQLYKVKTGGYLAWSQWLWRLVINYTKFLLQKPELWMFVPVSIDDRVLNEPDREYWHDERHGDYYYNIHLEQYKIAQSQVLFKGWEYKYDNGNGYIFKDGAVILLSTQDFTTIEELMNFLDDSGYFELTNTAIKQLDLN